MLILSCGKVNTIIQCPIRKVSLLVSAEIHCPGTFTHIVKNAFSERPIYTDKGIKLANPKFNVDKVDGIYLIHGSFIASSQQKINPWQETIHYFLFKKSEYGVTRGIWYTKYCRGQYRGKRIS